MRPRFVAGQVVVSVEHATPRVPAALGDLGVPRRFLDGHHGWDPGAATVGRRLARAFDAPLKLGSVSRLVADLNRSAFHPRVVPRTILPEGLPVPANAELDRVGRQRRLDRYWRPWREGVARALDTAERAHGSVLHLSIHSFTPELAGEVRDFDFGLLYKPSRPLERALADRLHARLAAVGFVVRRNRPYSGLDDGFCMRLRAGRSGRRYVGMEIELNQRDSAHASGVRRLATAIRAAFDPEIETR